MAILDTDPTNGWLCPTVSGTAGYTLDANDHWFMDVVLGKDSTWDRSTGTDKTATYFINQVDRQLYSTGASILEKSTAVTLFGKPVSKWHAQAAIGAPPINFGTGDFTVSGWFNYLYTSRLYNYTLSSPTLGTSGVITQGETFSYAVEEYVNYQWQPVKKITTSIPAVTGQWHYVSLIRRSGILYLYVDGVLGGQVASTDIYNGAVCISSPGNGWWPTDPYGYIRDMRVSWVARDGAFVPGNVFGS